MPNFPLVFIPEQFKKGQNSFLGNISNLPTVNPQEDTFYWYYLDKLFPEQVKRRVAIQSYTPDFIWFNSTIGLHIDIELDEPYVYDTKEPTHYHEVYGSIDHTRNQFFNKQGWIIIRFAEEQIVRWPDSCCKTIATVIANVTGNHEILKDFSRVPDLPVIKQWNKVEAIEMAENNYRDTYLSQLQIQKTANSATQQYSQNTFIDTLKRFVRVEADTQKRHIHEIWRKPIGERVLEGYAINEVEILEVSEKRLKLRCQQNISKFDIGDNLLLNRGNPLDKNNTYTCVLEKEIDEELIVTAGYQQSFDNLAVGKGWVLDRALVDASYILLNTLNALESSTSLHQYILDILGGQSKPQIINLEKIRNAENCAININLLAKQKEALIGALATENYYLIQGPPGTGKTWLLAHIATALARSGQRVLITAFTHAAINNALQKIVRTTGYNRVFKIGQEDRTDGLTWDTGSIPNYEYFNRSPYSPDAQGLIIGSTCYSVRGKRLQEVYFDTVIFDESGQITLPIAIAGMMASKRYIFIGDHKQMPPVIVGRHAEKWVTNSIFETLFNHAPGTMLDVTHRMNTEINAFPSKYFYQGKLQPSPLAKTRRLQFINRPLRHINLLDPNPPDIFVEIAHTDKGMRSPDEAKLASELVMEALNCGVSLHEIAVVVPYLAQARLIRKNLQKLSLTYTNKDIRSVLVDTVESIQGQERDIIIVSLTTSDPLHAAQRAEFYFQLNRLNVAITRAKVKRIVIGSPSVFYAEPKQKEHLSWVECFKNFYHESNIIQYPI